MYQVPMVELDVLVSVAGSEPEEHTIFLARYSENHDGEESLPEYLNSPRRFFPMVASGAPRIVNRQQISWIRLPRITDSGAAEYGITERSTIVELLDGTRLEGSMPIDRPAEQSRISDVLNDPSEIFVRMDDEGVTYFVNKAFIRQVIPS